MHQKWIWFAFTLAVAICIGALAMLPAIKAPYAIHNDARAHLAWMQRFADPQLFPDDLISDYFQQTEPTGYSLVYRAGSYFGISPMRFAIFLSVFLAVAASVLCFQFTWRLYESPATAWLAAFFLNVIMWSRPDICSGIARAFAIPLLLLFCNAMLSRSIIPLAIALTLPALFYPPMFFICWLAAFLDMLAERKLWKSSVTLGLSGAVGVGVMLHSAFNSRFGSLVTMSEAQTMPYFLPGTRSEIFSSDKIQYYLFGRHTGLLESLVHLPFIAIGLLMPILYLNRERIQEARKISNRSVVLFWIVAASIMLFVAAHVLAFRLYLPSRYTRNSFQVVAAVSAAIVLGVICRELWFRFLIVNKARRNSAHFIRILLLASLIYVPFTTGPFLNIGYTISPNNELYSYFRKEPKDIVIASLSGEANNLPVFCGRKVLSGTEFLLPWHPLYYWEIYNRHADLIRAQYSTDPQVLRGFLEKYHVTFFLLDTAWRQDFYLHQRNWTPEFQPQIKEVSARIKKDVPYLNRFRQQCATFRDSRSLVLSARCIQETMRLETQHSAAR